MALEVERVDTWAVSLEDKPGSLAATFSLVRYTLWLLIILSGSYCSASAQPRLHITTQSNALLVSWFEPADHFILETTDKIEVPTQWWPARLAALTAEDAQRVRITPLATNRFYRLATNNYVNWFQSVQGPVDAKSVGVVLPHEHIFTDLRGPTVSGYGQADAEDVVRVMKPLLVQAKDQGISLVVECTGIGVGRNVKIMQRLNQESGLPVVIPTGVYGRANFAPPEHRAMSEDQLAQLFIKELQEGIDNTGVKAGFIKIATGEAAMTALEEKILRAAGRAARETGAAVASHTTLGSNAKKQVDILATISPAIRFIWVHAQSERNRKLHRDLAARGVFIEFDSLGWAPAEDANLIVAIKELLEAGYGDRILLSHDAGWYQPGQANGGTQKPYTYLLGTFVPKLRQAGLDEATLQMLIQENPVRAFAFTGGVGAAGFPVQTANPAKLQRRAVPTLPAPLPARPASPEIGSRHSRSVRPDAARWARWLAPSGLRAPVCSTAPTGAPYTPAAGRACPDRPCSGAQTGNRAGPAGPNDRRGVARDGRAGGHREFWDHR